MTYQSILNSFAEQKFFTKATYLTGKANKTELVCYPQLQQRQLVSEYIFDVASLTKVFVTGSMLVDAINHGLDIQAPLNQFSSISKVLEIKHPNIEKITIAELISHTSGIAPWFPLYSLDKKNTTVFWNLILSRATRDNQRRYSDLGFILLGKILEEYLQVKIDLWFKQNIIVPLDLKFTGYRHQLQQYTQNAFVPTSMGNPFEKILARKVFFEWQSDLEKEGIKYLSLDELSYRNYRLQGECNDANAFHLDQVAPHAGLFSTANDLSKVVQYWLTSDENHISVFKNLLNLNQGSKEHLFCATDATLSWNKNKNLFGHHGFTGCSFAMDTNFDSYQIFTSNRQYYGLDEQGNYPQWKKILNFLSQ